MQALPAFLDKVMVVNIPPARTVDSMHGNVQHNLVIAMRKLLVSVVFSF